MVTERRVDSEVQPPSYVPQVDEGPLASHWLVEAKGLLDGFP